MAAGLFELRKDPITGWWVATVVDRAFHRDRFARAAESIDDRLFGCANCSTPEGDGVRVRMLKDFAFHVVGTGDDARELNSGLAQVALAQARATGSWRTIVAPPGEHRPLHAVGTEMIEALVATCAAYGVAAARRDGHPGCWCDPDGADPRKIGALGLRIERGVSYHGIALNVSVDLADFDLIDPCGMPGVASTSIASEQGETTAAPTTASVEHAAGIFAGAFAAGLGAPLTGI